MQNINCTGIDYGKLHVIHCVNMGYKICNFIFYSTYLTYDTPIDKTLYPHQRLFYDILHNYYKVIKRMVFI